MAQEAPHLNARQRIRCAIAAAALMVSGTAPASEFAAQVYRDAAIEIHAGVAGINGRTLRFGDLLRLHLVITYDPDEVSILDADTDFSMVVWPDSFNVAKIERQVREGSGPKGQTTQLQTTIQFQILGCPNDELTCPGNRTYRLPEFSLAYRKTGMTNGDAESVVFRPWPETLTVMTTIARDNEDQLYPFENYFPTGGYPDPLSGEDTTRASALTVGIALAIFLGGVLMWPFSFGARQESARQAPRWKTLLQQLGDDDTEDESRYLDSLRRCFVWYCNDELDIDPFIWLDLAETSDEDEVDRGHSELRSVFVELLQNPPGRGAELRARLQALTRQSGAA